MAASLSVFSSDCKRAGESLRFKAVPSLNRAPPAEAADCMTAVGPPDSVPLTGEIPLDTAAPAFLPSGVAPAVILEPKGAALLAAKILTLARPELAARIADAQRKATEQMWANLPEEYQWLRDWEWV